MRTTKGSSTMSNVNRLLAAALALGLSAAAVRAAESGGARPKEADLVMLLNTIRANRQALVAVNLKLTGEENARFWPLYERYQQEMNAAGDRMAAVVEDYTTHFGDLGDDKALRLVTDYLAADADRARIRRAYVDEFAKILPGRTVARFFQIENKMDAVVRYSVASTIPVVAEESSPPKP